MYKIQWVFKYIRNGALVLLLCIMAWQQWTTFLRHEEKFLNPIEYTKQNYGNDFISVYGLRFNEIKKMFPSPTKICYFGEENEYFPTWSAQYSLAQYYLAPHILIREVKHSYSRFFSPPNTIFEEKDTASCDTIIYNLHQSIHIDPKTNFHLNNGWHVVKDFNNGLIVLAK